MIPQYDTGPHLKTIACKAGTAPEFVALPLPDPIARAAKSHSQAGGAAPHPLQAELGGVLRKAARGDKFRRFVKIRHAGVSILLTRP